MKVLVFGGTTEGRELVEFLNTQPCRVTACVATEYGQTLLPEGENLTVSARPLPVGEIGALLQAERFDLVIDATHPYAVDVSSGIETDGTKDPEKMRSFVRAVRGGAGEERDA